MRSTRKVATSAPSSKAASVFNMANSILSKEARLSSSRGFEWRIGARDILSLQAFQVLLHELATIARGNGEHSEPRVGDKHSAPLVARDRADELRATAIRLGSEGLVLALLDPEKILEPLRPIQLPPAVKRLAVLAE